MFFLKTIIEALLLQLEYCYCQFKKSFLLFYGFLDFSLILSLTQLLSMLPISEEIVIEAEKQLKEKKNLKLNAYFITARPERYLYMKLEHEFHTDYML